MRALAHFLFFFNGVHKKKYTYLSLYTEKDRVKQISPKLTLKYLGITLEYFKITLEYLKITLEYLEVS